MDLINSQYEQSECIALVFVSSSAFGVEEFVISEGNNLDSGSIYCILSCHPILKNYFGIVDIGTKNINRCISIFSNGVSIADLRAIDIVLQHNKYMSH